MAALTKEQKSRLHRAPQADTAVRSCREVAAIMTLCGLPMTTQRVQELERQALRKLYDALVGRGVR